MSQLTPDLTAYDYASVLAQQLGASTEEIRTELSGEVTALSDWLDDRHLQMVEPWPFDRGPDGPLRTDDGNRLHGAARSDPHPDQPTFDLIVANNGFPLSAVRCAGPIPPPLPLMTPISCVVANTGALLERPHDLAALEPDEAALNLVVHRRKPVGLLTAEDAAVVERWQHLAHERGCDVLVEHVDDRCCGAAYWFVEVARREPLGELLALDDLIEWWSAALPAVGLGALRSRVERDLRGLADQPASSFIGRGSDLIMAPMCDDSPSDGLPTWVVGAVLGYWPPTSLSLMLNHGHRGTLVPAAGDADLRTWRALHHALVAPT
jgi:hypothetical protein